MGRTPGHADSPQGSLPRFFAAPPDLLRWTHGAVAVRLPGTCAHSHFPASVDGMLVLRARAVLFEAMQDPGSGSGATLALDHRYWDQSHMGRDLKR